jgi:D-glycero-D-manno-heptose 1,7-bisphosphate phosphatase
METANRMTVMNKAIFIDKDGTLIHDVPYNANPSLIRLQEGAARGLKQLKEKGYLLILISNQSGIAHGYFKKEDLDQVKKKLQHDLKEQADVELDALYFCPHHPQGRIREFARSCECRKPKPGLILQAAENFNVDLSQSWMIGDILHDVEAGNKAGCHTILITNGHETEWQMNAMRHPTDIAHNIPEAASIILQRQDHDE